MRPPRPAPPARATLGHNLIAFGRLLRRAGLPVGPSEILAGAAALECIDIGERGLKMRSML